jgi:hypothetical protein
MSPPDKGNGFRKLGLVRGRFGDEAQQHRDKNRADHDQDDVKQKPDQYRDQCHQNDDRGPREEFDSSQLRPRPLLSV